jgi:hypothetical protein
MIARDHGTVMPSTYSPSALPAKAGRGLILPLPKFLIGRWSIILKCISFFPRIPIPPDLSRPFPGGPSPLSFFFRRRTLFLPTGLFTLANGSRWIYPPAPLSYRALHLSRPTGKQSSLFLHFYVGGPTGRPYAEQWQGTFPPFYAYSLPHGTRQGYIPCRSVSHSPNCEDGWNESAPFMFKNVPLPGIV